MSSFLFSFPTGSIQETSNLGGSALIPKAQGAQVDSAALTVQSAPFLASVNTGDASASSIKNAAFFYNQGAVKDPGQATLTSKRNIVASNKKKLLYGVVYQVQSGDTIDSISAAYNVPKDKIIQFNPSVNFSSLDTGISIIVPGENDVNVFSGQD